MSFVRYECLKDVTNIPNTSFVWMSQRRLRNKRFHGYDKNQNYIKCLVYPFSTFLRAGVGGGG